MLRELARWGTQSRAGRVGGALGSGGRSCGDVGLDHLRWADLGQGLRVQGGDALGTGCSRSTGRLPLRPLQASPVMGPLICTSAGTMLHPIPLPVCPAPGTCPGTVTVRCPLECGPFLIQRAPNPCPRHHFPKTHLHPISCSSLSIWVSPLSVRPWLGHPDPGSVTKCPFSVSYLSEDNPVLVFSPFSEPVFGHPGLPVLTSYVVQGNLFNFFIPQSPHL